jgi:hypothetical protein
MVAANRCGESGATIIANRNGNDGSAQSPTASRSGMSRSTPSTLRVTLPTALNRVIASPYGNSSATVGSSRGSGCNANAPGAAEMCNGEPAS